MDNLYLKKEGIVRRCIEEGQKYFSSYQMQIVKSNFYTAIVFNKESDDYKNRIDKIYNYCKETLLKNIERAKKRAKKRKIKELKELKNKKIHNYITEKEENIKERAIAFNDKEPLPRKLKIDDKDFLDLNRIYDVKDKLNTTNNIFSLLKNNQIDIGFYIKTMVDHSFLSFIAKDELNNKYPRYIEARKEMFEYIENAINDEEMNKAKFLYGILNNEVLLRQFMHEVEPLYLDKTSDEYKLIKRSVKTTKNNDMNTIRKLIKLETSINNMKINDEIIDLIINSDEKRKKKTL